MTRPIIAVTGATGAQGGGLVRALLADPQKRFAVRALTRQPTSAKGKALADAGAEVVAADLDDPASLEPALRGAHGVFAVTNFWEHLSPEREIAQAGHLAAAVRAAKPAHVIWSTLEDTRKDVPLDDPRLPTLMGRYKVPHFDSKGEANELFRAAGRPLTLLHTSFYWDNLIHFGMAPQRGPDGGLVFVLPMANSKLPGIAADDIGACAFGVFAQGAPAGVQEIGIAGEHLNGAEMARSLARVMGEPVQHIAMAPSDYAQLGFPGAADLANMFQYKRDFNDAYLARRSVAATRALHPGLQSFGTWLDRHRAELPVPPRAA